MRFNLIALGLSLLLVTCVGVAINADYTPTDTDSDSFVDERDNCTTTFNHSAAGQMDSDCDGYGNACDGDFNNDGKVNVTDYAVFKATYGLADGELGYNSRGNLDCRGKVNVIDFGMFKAVYDAHPGASEGLDPDSCTACYNQTAGFGLEWGCASMTDSCPTYYSLNDLDHIFVKFQDGHRITKGNTKTVPIIMYSPSGFDWPEDDICYIKMRVNDHHEPASALECGGLTTTSSGSCASFLGADVPSGWTCSVTRPIHNSTQCQYEYILDASGNDCLLEADWAASGYQPLLEIDWSVYSGVTIPYFEMSFPFDKIEMKDGNDDPVSNISTDLGYGDVALIVPE